MILLVWLCDPAHLEAFWGNTALPERRLHLVQPHHDPAAHPRVPGSDLVMSSRATKSTYVQSKCAGHMFDGTSSVVVLKQ